MIWGRSSFNCEETDERWPESSRRPWSRRVRSMLQRALYIFPKIMLRAIRQQGSGSSAIRYWVRRSSTFPELAPVTRAKKLDGLDALCAFAGHLERAALDTVEDGVMTGDLAPLCDTPVEAVDTDTFMASIRTRLDMRMQSA